MTRTSAIFGVVSVLTAAIVGGVFIRKKIIDDALYWRAWMEAEGRWKREIKELERNINELESGILEKNKSKVRKEKQIEKHEIEIKELHTSIEEIKEKMNSSEHYFIPTEVVKIVNKNFDRQGDLQERIKGFTDKVSEFNKNILSDEEIGSEDKISKLKKKIEEFSEILKIQKEKLKAYADRRIELFRKFQQYKTKKGAIEEQQKNLEKKLGEDKSLLNGLDNLIKQLQEVLSEKTKSLFSLRARGPVITI